MVAAFFIHSVICYQGLLTYDNRVTYLVSLHHEIESEFVVHDHTDGFIPEQ